MQRRDDAARAAAWRRLWALLLLSDPSEKDDHAAEQLGERERRRGSEVIEDERSITA